MRARLRAHRRRARIADRARHEGRRDRAQCGRRARLGGSRLRRVRRLRTTRARGAALCQGPGVGEAPRHAAPPQVALPLPPCTPYPALAEAMRAAAQEQLPRKSKPRPGWFEAAAPELLALIAKRDTALGAHHRQPTQAAAARLRAARGALQSTMRRAQSEWIIETCKLVGDGAKGAVAWDCVKKLRSGLHGKPRPTAAKMKLPDGSLTSTPEETPRVRGRLRRPLQLAPRPLGLLRRGDPRAPAGETDGARP